MNADLSPEVLSIKVPFSALHSVMNSLALGIVAGKVGVASENSRSPLAVRVQHWTLNHNYKGFRLKYLEMYHWKIQELTLD